MSRSNQLAGLITATPTATLDTINEINASLNNDNDLAGSLTNSIATKANKSGDTFTGNVIINKAGTTTEPTMRVTSALESSSGIHSHGFSATFLNTSNNANAHGVAIGSKHADSNSLIIGQHDTTFDHFIVKGDGNVGVGVDPSSKLHVYDSADHTRLSVQCANSSGRHWQFQSRNDGVFWIRDDTAGANRMIFNSSGQVGIGCTPSHHLHIEPSGWTDHYLTLHLKHPDSTASRFATLNVRADDNNGVQIGVGSSGTSTSSFYRQSYIESYGRDLNLSTYTGGYNITFRTAPSGGSATEIMRIASNGNVGIGTDNPSNTKLEVHNSGRTFDVYRTTTSNSSMLIAAYSDYGVTKNLVFEVWSGGSVYNDTGVYTTFPSDERLKTEIKETSSKLDKLLQLPIKSYYTTKNPEFKKMGVIAQDLEKVFPSLVDFANVDETTPMVQKDDNGKLLLNDEGKPYVLDKNGDKLSKIKYTKDSLLLFCAIKAIQELSAKVTALENA